MGVNCARLCDATASGREQKMALMHALKSLSAFATGGNAKVIANSIAFRHANNNQDFCTVFLGFVEEIGGDAYQVNDPGKAKKARVALGWIFEGLVRNYATLGALVLSVNAAPNSTPIMTTIEDYAPRVGEHLLRAGVPRELVMGDNDVEMAVLLALLGANPKMSGSGA
jgi:hypothetical protein